MNDLVNMLGSISKKGSILIVDDAPENLLLLMRLLTSQGYEVRQANNGLAAIESAIAEPPDLILLDIQMPVMDGYTVCERIKSNPITREISVIFVSALGKSFDKVRAFSAGGVDYLTKPIEPEELIARIETHLKISMLQRELEQNNKRLHAEIERRRLVEEQLRLQTFLDPLTGIYNRRYFFEYANKELARVARSGNVLSIMMFDIDHFKKVNDTYGHLAGDFVLQNLTRVVHEILRDHDVFARYGGEEFIILLPETNQRQSKLVAERIRKHVEKVSNDYEGTSIQITISLGIGSNETTQVPLIETIIDWADQALYRSKQSGRNQTHCWNEIEKTA